MAGARPAQPGPLPWTVPDAPYRALVQWRNAPRNPETGVLIDIPELGLIRPDMADLVLTDIGGQVLPLAKVSTIHGGRVQVLGKDFDRRLDTRLLYFGGNRVRNAPTWTPRLSLYMETRRAPAVMKYDTFQDVKAAWDSAPRVDGGGFVWGIFHGENPFGDSYNFVTHYTGYLPISSEKPIVFYTLSSDASFVLVNDRLEFGWPGRHTPRALPNQVQSQSVRCHPPYVKIDYYAVKGPVDNPDRRDAPGMVFGWKGADNQFAAVPGDAWLHPGVSLVTSIEQKNGPALPEPTVIAETMIGYADQWYYETRFGFIQPAANLAGWTAKWEFEDGATVFALAGKRVLVNSEPQIVKVSLTPPVSGSGIAPTPITLLSRIVFSDRIARASIRNAEDTRRYAALMDADNPATLKSGSHGPRLKFLLDWGTDPQITKYADSWPEKEGIVNDPVYGSTWVNARLIAIRTHAQTNPAGALAELATLEPRIRTRFPFAAEPVEVDLRVFYLCNAESAGRLGQIAFQYPASDLAKTAKIRVGDLYRLLGRFKEAVAQYQSIGIKTDDPSLPAQDRAASIAIDEMLQSGFRTEAMAKLNEWERKHPMAKFDSDFLLLRARALMFHGRWTEAMREIDSFEKVQPESPGVIDAEFLRARVLYERGRKDEARKIWNDLVKSYPKHPLTQEAKTWAAAP